MRNGVDLAAVEQVVEGFRREPASGRRPFAATVRWLGGFRTESLLGSAVLVRGDEPVELAGLGSGPSPEDMLLGAIGQCLIVGLAGSAAARGISIERLEVRVHGAVNLAAAYGLEAGASPGFEAIEIEVALEPAGEVERAALEALLEHAMALAPIPNTIARPVPIEARLA